jgi:hypothetical protein
MCIEGTELAIHPADVGVVDISIYDKGRHTFGMHLFFTGIRHFPQSFEIGILYEIDGFVYGHTHGIPLVSLLVKSEE